MTATTSMLCSRCGSSRIEVRDTPPHSGWLEKMKTQMAALLRRQTFCRRSGRLFIVCKDCGHISCLHIH